MRCRACLKIRLPAPVCLGAVRGNGGERISALLFFSPDGLATVWRCGRGAGAFLLVWLISFRHGTTMMILSGVAVNVLLGAAVTLLLSNAESPWALAELYRWLQGSLVWATAEAVCWALPLILLGIVCLYRERRYLDLLTFGEETAATMGINLQRSFFTVSIGVALLVGATIPQTGTIGFIGLIAPHLARIWLKKPPSSFILPPL